MGTPVSDRNLRKEYAKALETVWGYFDEHFPGVHPWKDSDLNAIMHASALTPVEKGILMYSHGFVSGVAAATGWSYRRPR